MKISILYSLVFITGMALSSTSHAQGITITKRHYKAGYYVDFGSKKKNITAQHETENIAVADAKSVNAMPSANTELTEPMNLVAVQNVVVKREKTVKHIAAANHAISSPTVNVVAKMNESYNSTSAVRDDSPNNVSAVQHDDAGINLLLVVIITIFIPPLGVALVRGIHLEFWLDLILTLLFYIPGLIYGLIVVLS